MQILLNCLGKTLVLSREYNDIESIKFHISDASAIPCEDFFLTRNGRILSDMPDKSETIFLTLKLKLLGGKGGFGSLLKGQAPVKKRTNNFDSCRDLSGRRLRHVNQEKMIHQWQQKKNEEERFVEEHENPENEQIMKNHMNHYKGIELTVLEKKFHQDSKDTTDSVSNSVKYLMKKRNKNIGNINLPKKKNNVNIEELFEFKSPNNHNIFREIKELNQKTVTLPDMNKFNDIFD